MTRAYKFKTVPYDHQMKTWRETRDLDVYALFWEMGCGKTKVIIDTAAWLYDKEKIDGLLIIAPAGVHRNWITDEIPVHMPDSVRRQDIIWRAGRARTQRFRREAKDVLKFDGLAIAAMNVESVITDLGRKFIETFLRTRRCMFVVDESEIIKTPKAKRTKAINAYGLRAPYRRILTGTPVTQGPLDLYSQLRFLSPAILGFRTMYGFRQRYAEWDQGYDPRTGRTFDRLVRYQNMNELVRKLEPVSSRVTKDECLDLPPKVYEKRYFQLSTAQRTIYDLIASEIIVELEDRTLTVPNILARFTRLQQVTSGLLPREDSDGGVDIIEGPRPRIDALLDVVRGARGQLIVWARFTADIESVRDALREVDVTCATYHGGTGTDERAEALRAFEAGDIRVLVGNPKAGGRGLTLVAASTVVYYSNGFSYGDRVQSEDRAHRIGQTKTVTYVDLIAEDTLDERIISVLRTKKNLADVITGDDPKSWL